MPLHGRYKPMEQKEKANVLIGIKMEPNSDHLTTIWVHKNHPLMKSVSADDSKIVVLIDNSKNN